MNAMIRSRPFDNALEHAAGQHGLISAAEAKAIGINPAYLRKWAQAGKLEHRERGIYRVTVLPVTSHTEYQEAVLWADGQGVIGGESAIALWDLADVNPRHITILIPKKKQIRKAGVHRFQLQRKSITADDIDYVENIPVLAPEVAIRHVIDSGLEGTLVMQAIQTARRRELIGPLAEARLRVRLADRATLK